MHGAEDTDPSSPGSESAETPATREASATQSGAGEPGAAAPTAAPDATGGSVPSPSGGEGDASGTDEAPKRRRRRRRRRKPTPDGAVAAGDGTDPDPETPARIEAGAPVGDGDPGVPGARPKARAKRKRPRKPAGGSETGGNARSGARGGQRNERHSAMRAISSLSELAERLLEVEGVDLFARPRWMDVKLRIPLDASRDGKQAATAVMDQIVARVREVLEHERALVPGSVYSYFHERADADGCRPQTVREVFDGYTSTGKPQWSDFVTMAIDRKDDGIDQLVEGEDIIVTHVTMGRVLRTQQLVEFGKRSPVYRLLGQVDAGLFPVLRSDGKAAFSFQLLKGTTLEGKPRLRIHSVGAAELTDLADPSIAQILHKFQQRLDAESLRLAGLETNGNAPSDEDFVLPLLQDLARQLAGQARRKNRRTDHASQRSDEGQRPTAKAFGDAKQATDDVILCDDVQDTVVVVGPKGRVHVFTHDAFHVTSLVMQGGAVQKRRSQGRWRLADPDERGNFRIGLSQRLGEQAAEDGSGAG